MKRNFLALIEAASFVFLKQRYSVEQEGMLMKWRIVLLLKKRKTLFWKVDCKKKIPIARDFNLSNFVVLNQINIQVNLVF